MTETSDRGSQSENRVIFSEREKLSWSPRLEIIQKYWKLAKCYFRLGRIRGARRSMAFCEFSIFFDNFKTWRSGYFFSFGKYHPIFGLDQTFQWLHVDLLIAQGDLPVLMDCAVLEAIMAHGRWNIMKLSHSMVSTRILGATITPYRHLAGCWGF